MFELMERNASKAGKAQFAPGLYITATPIGNAADISLRALDLLRGADLVLCEDTRVTSKLFTIHGIQARMLPYHDHNAAEQRPKILERLRQGQVIALVSDAGTPLVSDPGYKLVQDAVAAGYHVTTLPGASSVLAALTLAALPTDRFFFAGFPNSRQEARRRELKALTGIPATLVFLESAQRLEESLRDMAAAFGAREAAVARELTKKFEEVQRGTLLQLATHYAASGAPKGEIVIVVGPPAAQVPLCQHEVDAMIENALQRLSLKDAVAEIVSMTDLPRKDVYARALELNEKDE